MRLACAPRHGTGKNARLWLAHRRPGALLLLAHTRPGSGQCTRILASPTASARMSPRFQYRQGDSCGGKSATSLMVVASLWMKHRPATGMPLGCTGFPPRRGLPDCCVCRSGRDYPCLPPYISERLFQPQSTGTGFTRFSCSGCRLSAGSAYSIASPTPGRTWYLYTINTKLSGRRSLQ